MLSHSRWPCFFIVSLLVGLNGIRAAAGVDDRSRGLLADANKLPPRAVARLGSLAFWHGESIHTVALAPNGKLAATGGWGKYVPDGPSGKPRLEYDPHIRL